MTAAVAGRAAEQSVLYTETQCSEAEEESSFSGIRRDSSGGGGGGTELISNS
jgi:hypothetical protein